MSTLRQYPRKLAGAMFFLMVVAAFALAMAGAVRAQDDPLAGDDGVGGAGAAQVQSPDIVGGREATPGAWPWQVALISHFYSEAYNGFFCGGTIVAPEWVLTAAHCVDGAEASLIDVLVGAHRLSENEPRMSVDMVLVYPAYSDYAVDGDLALLHLTQPVTQTPITLFALDGITTEFDYLRATVTGWGDTNPYSWFGEYPDALQEVSLPLVDKATCNEKWFLGITDNLICAGYTNMPKGACYGDSGGPLMVQEASGQWLQVGIVSFGAGYCVGSDRPDVFTRVAKYQSWIQGCLADVNGRECRGADIYEPDNYPASAQLLPGFGVTQTHTFHELGDQDWIKFDVKAGNLYMVQTHVVPTFTLAVDTVVWLFDNEGRTPLTYNDNAGGLPPVPNYGTPVRDAQLIWQARADGQFFVSVENIAPTVGTVPTFGSAAQYAIVVEEMAHVNYMPEVLRVEPTPSGFPAPIIVPVVGEPAVPVLPTPVPAPIP